jgi:hypothetical protein
MLSAIKAWLSAMTARAEIRYSATARVSILSFSPAEACDGAATAAMHRTAADKNMPAIVDLFIEYLLVGSRNGHFLMRASM